MAAEYFSFEDVLGELDVGEEELKRMVSEGELRAFRDENKMKFRKEDVENLRKGRTTEPTLILPAQDEGGGTGDTILDLDTGVPEGGTDDAGPAINLPGAPAKSSRSASETQDVTEQLDFSDTDVTIADDSPPVDVASGEAAADSDETGLSTEPLQLVEEGATEPLPAEEAPVEEEAAAAASAAPKKGRRRQAVGIPPEVEEEIERRRPHWIWSVLMVTTFLAALYAGFFVFDLLRIQAGRAEKPTGITLPLADEIANNFYGDQEWVRLFKFDAYSPNTVPDVFKNKPSWRYTQEELGIATRGIPIDGPDGSMRPGSGTPAEAPPADQKPPEEKKEGQPAPAGEAGPAAGGGAKPAGEAGAAGEGAKPTVESGAGGGGGAPAGTNVEGMPKAGGP